MYGYMRLPYFFIHEKKQSSLTAGVSHGSILHQMSIHLCV